MLFPHTCTIYNRYREGKEDKWQRTVLSGILWDNVRGINARSGAVNNEDSAVIIIPFRSRTGYETPKAFTALTDKNAAWTLNVGDIIVLGAIDFEFDDTHRLADLERQYDDVLTITKVDRRIFESDLDHWEVGAK